MEHLYYRPYHLPYLMVDKALAFYLEPEPLIVLGVSLASYLQNEPFGGWILRLNSRTVIVIVPGPHKVLTHPIYLIQDLLGVGGVFVEDLDRTDIAVYS